MRKFGQTGHIVATVDNCPFRTESSLFDKSITTNVTFATRAVLTVQIVFISAHDPWYFKREASVLGYTSAAISPSIGYEVYMSGDTERIHESECM